MSRPIDGCLAFACLTLASAISAGEARAAGTCSDPSAFVVEGACPPGVSFEGCCREGHAVWCEPDGTFCALSCLDQGLACGWLASGGFYGCTTVPGEDPSGQHPIACDWDCTPSCAGKECGDDGCLGNCGTCSGETPECDATGRCVACAPDCAGAECGDDGCGGQCGQCGGGEVCTAGGTCCTPDCAGAACGDDGCGGTCGDCGAGHVCVDGACETCTCDGKECGGDGCGNPCGTCTGGEGCLDGQCVAPSGGCVVSEDAGCDGCACEECVCLQDEFCCSDLWDEFCVDACVATCGGACPCMPDCAGKECGDDGCGGACGTCGPGTFCSPSGTGCTDCTCDDKECGDDGCGTSCGTCPAGETCAGGTCVKAGCAATGGPGCGGCECEACVCLTDPFCCTTMWDGECVAACEACGESCVCVPDCGGKECGSDGCGGSCGTCEGGEWCVDGLCCAPDCTGKECGDDGCGGTCGACDDGAVCLAGQCTECEPSCGDRECGDDGCGGSCGECETGMDCNGGLCTARYPEACLGPDVPSSPFCPSGDSLGVEGCCAGDRVVWCHEGQLYCMDCTAGRAPSECGWGGDPGAYRCGGSGADPSGGHPIACPCIPACSGRECGDDGCGGSCGTCGAGEACGPEGECVAAPAETTPDAPSPDAAADVPPEAVMPDAAPDVPVSHDTPAGDPGTETAGGGGGGGDGCAAGAPPATGMAIASLLLPALSLLGVSWGRRRSRGGAPAAIDP